MDQPLPGYVPPWQVDFKRTWRPAASSSEPKPLEPGVAFYCAPPAMHKICIGYDPQSLRPCSCSCHAAKRAAADLSD